MINPSIIQQHFFVPDTKQLTVHPEALQAHKAWLQFRVEHASITLREVDKYYKPIVQIIPYAKDHFVYFNSFERMSQILENEAQLSQPFMVIIDDKSQVTTMAWAEVLKLSFHREVNHQLLWQHLKEYCPANTLKALMNSDSLGIEDYCGFADIDRATYEQ